ASRPQENLAYSEQTPRKISAEQWSKPMRPALGVHVPNERKRMDAKQLYTDKIDTYLSFSSAFRSPQALRAFFKASGLLRADLRMLDAGCGAGAATIALVQALRSRGYGYNCMHAFDLTPAMLERFQKQLVLHNIADVELREQDVLELHRLPSSWTNYDLIVSVAMLEYIPRPRLVPTLAALRARLAPHGIMLLAITRKNWIIKFLIEQWWQAHRYERTELEAAFVAGGYDEIVFKRFPYPYFWQNQWAHVVEGRNG